MSFFLKVLYATWILSVSCVLCQQNPNVVDDDDDGGAVVLQDEESLIRHLGSTYFKKVAPEEPVILKYGIYPVKVVGVDVNRGLATIDVWLRHNWQDHRLSWDPTVYDVDVLYFNPKDIYVPEMALYYGKMTPTVPDPEVVVNSRGNMIYFKPMRAEIYCDFPSLPFTDVVCRMIIGPWAHNVRKTTLATFDPVVDTSFMQETGKCRIDESWAELNQSSYQCCPQTFGTMHFYVKISCAEVEDEPSIPAAELLKSAPDKTPVYPGSRQKCSLPLVITPFFVLLIFLLPQKATDRVFLGTIVFAALLLIWTSNVVPDDEERFLQLSAIVSISATFASLLPCRLSSAGTPATQAGEYGPKPSSWKNRVATMIDLMLFAAVAIVLGISTAGTFA